ncbi:MAG TPA: MgtC/SapB family protein [Sphingomicrobium sp.]|jgi:putative Mg2+ transporter-C (MgtC) family protein|nr:MgtC/SapB family protein [Sphingomicrobium sp.]
MTELLGADNFDLLPHLVALTLAYLLALPIGWNREKEERSAGLRTFPLVAVASCGFIQAAEGVLGGNSGAQARVIEGLITGMGFIGGGAILKVRDSVKGTATAASLWVTGAIGMSVGLGAVDVAVMLTIMAFVTLYLLAPLKKMVETEPEDAAAATGASASRLAPLSRPQHQGVHHDDGRVHASRQQQDHQGQVLQGRRPAG